MIAPAEYMIYWIWFTLLMGLGWLIFDDCILSLIEHGTWERSPNFVGRVLRDMGIDLTEFQADILVGVGTLVFLGIYVHKYNGKTLPTVSTIQ